jgi:hypothetical protein
MFGAGAFLALILIVNAPVNGTPQTVSASCDQSGLREVRSLGVAARPESVTPPETAGGIDEMLKYRGFDVQVEFSGRGCQVAFIRFTTRNPQLHMRLSNLSSWLASIEISPIRRGFEVNARSTNGLSVRRAFDSQLPLIALVLWDNGQRRVLLDHEDFSDTGASTAIGFCRGKVSFFQFNWPEPGLGDKLRVPLCPK